MADAIKFKFMLFGSLPKGLREDAVDVSGNSINAENIDPLALVCVQTTKNPGSTPFILSDSRDLFKFSQQIAQSIGFDVEEYSRRLSSKFK